MLLWRARNYPPQLYNFLHLKEHHILFGLLSTAMEEWPAMVFQYPGTHHQSGRGLILWFALHWFENGRCHDRVALTNQ